MSAYKLSFPPHFLHLFSLALGLCVLVSLAVHFSSSFNHSSSALCLVPAAAFIVYCHLLGLGFADLWVSFLISRTVTQGISPVFSSNAHGFTFALPQASQSFPKLSLAPFLSCAPQIQKWHKVKMKPSSALLYQIFNSRISSYSINWTNAGNHTSNHMGIQTSILCQRKEKRAQSLKAEVGFL